MSAVATGTWVTLAPLGDIDPDELRALDERRERLPELGGAFSRNPELTQVVGIRGVADGRLLGMIAAPPQPNQPGTVTLCIYIDREIARPGFAIEAVAMYVDWLFRTGVSRIIAEVLDFNRKMIRLMDRAGFAVCARLREHDYAAGAFWDVLVFSFDADDWVRSTRRFRDRFPDGTRKPAAFG